MTLSKEALTSIYDDFSACSSGDYDISTLAFSTAKLIIDAEEISILSQIPKDLAERIYELADIYRSSGKLEYLSSLGSTDHSEMAKKLVKLIDNQRI